MPEYRDYGAFWGRTAPLVEISNVKNTQVYTATHEGDQRSPFMKRSFISFSYDGKLIEDFNLLAIIENNSLQRKIYAEFEDSVSESEVWDGQIYWGSHYKSNELAIALFTDGITEQQLDEFKNYFQPGKIEELILSEHPNRAIMARVGETPEYSILPFEEKITVKIAGEDYETSTTLYKGRINIKFVMDDPFWYSRANLLDKIDGEIVDGIWINANGNRVHLLHDKDAIKVMQEDGVPFSAMLYDLPDNELHPINALTTAVTANNAQTFGAYTDNTSHLPVSVIVGDEYLTQIEANSGELAVEAQNIGDSQLEYIVSNTDDGFTIDQNQCGYFFYAGSAPCSPILTFSFTPTFSSDGYINFPKNRYTDTDTPYNTITIECQEKQIFAFSTPGILTGYNQVIEIFKSSRTISKAWEDIRADIRTTVKHWAPRQYACYVIDQVAGQSVSATSTNLENCITSMKNFIKNSNGDIAPIYVSFNCKNGHSIGHFVYRNKLNEESELFENIGDMVRSNYLIIKEKNIFDENGYISAWQQGKRYSHRIYSDCTLNNVSLKYKYLYL